jgi:hypothetical protein
MMTENEHRGHHNRRSPNKKEYMTADELSHRRNKMRNPEILFKVAEARRKDLLREAEQHRRHQTWLKGQSNVSGPKFTLALIGTTLAAVLVSLIA